MAVVLRKKNRALRRSIVLIAVMLGAAANAEERWDHRGAAGIFGSVGATASSRAGAATGSDLRPALATDLGATIAVGHDGSEVRAYGRLLFSALPVGGALGAGYRGFFGDGRWKSFMDLDLLVHVVPTFHIGPRIGLGVAYELSPVMGMFAGIAAHFGGGTTFLFSGEGLLGIQFRSYLLE